MKSRVSKNTRFACPQRYCQKSSPIMWCLQLWYIGYGDGGEGRTLIFTIEKVDQANSTITVGISAGGEGWVWKSEKMEHDRGRPRHSKNMSLPGLWCIQCNASRSSPSMSKVIQMLEGDVDITTHPFLLTRVCSYMPLTNCFGGSNDKSNKY